MDAGNEVGQIQREILDAEKKVEEAQRRRQEIRGKQGGGAMGVGARMGWS